MRIAIAQINNTLLVDKNMETIIKYLDAARNENIDAIVFPETALTGYTSDTDKLKSIKLEDHKINRLKEISKESNIDILIGAVTKRDNKLYNSYLHIDADKDIDLYDKTHLGIREEKIYKKGEELNTFNVKETIVGTAICIESHIPEIFLTHRLNGAKIIITPFASPKRAGDKKEIWKKYLLARAYDNGVYIIATNLVGKLDGLEFSGGMLAINPNGEIVKEYYDFDENMIIVDIDIDKYSTLHSNHKKNYIKRRRSELYRND